MINAIYKSKTDNNICFKNTSSNIAQKELFQPFTKTSESLIKKANNMLEKHWKLIRKNKLKTPQDFEFKLKVLKHNILLKPVYNDPLEDKFLMQISTDNSAVFENIILDRKAKNYVYEKNIKTDFGYSTLKTRNSKFSHDNETQFLVNYYVENFFPHIIKAFDKSEGD